jgi:hypothetical protein
MSSCSALKTELSVVTKRPGPGKPVSTTRRSVPTLLPGGQASPPRAISSASEASQRGTAEVSNLAPGCSRTRIRSIAGGFPPGLLGSKKSTSNVRPVEASVLPVVHRSS